MYYHDNKTIFEEQRTLFEKLKKQAVLFKEYDKTNLAGIGFHTYQNIINSFTEKITYYLDPMLIKLDEKSVIPLGARDCREDVQLFLSHKILGANYEYFADRTLIKNKLIKRDFKICFYEKINPPATIQIIHRENIIYPLTIDDLKIIKKYLENENQSIINYLQGK
jgi:hypothetical protein